MDLLESLKATYSLLGQEVNDLGLEMLAQDLAGYPVSDIQQALGRCRKELKRITPTDIIDRIPGGHPGPEEAWGIVTRAMGNEQVSLVWTDEMREAYGSASALVGDEVAARLAFKEVYLRAVSEARAKGQQPKWTVSLGYDPRGREAALLEAVEKGRLLPEVAYKLLPNEPDHCVVERLRKEFPRLLGNDQGGTV